MLKKLFYLILSPLLIIAKLMPKKSNLWIFGSWYGHRFADNSKYLFEYVKHNYKDIKPIWLTHEKEIYWHLKNKEYEVAYIYSLKGFWVSARAQIAFCTQSLSDLNRWGINKAIVVQLWHGHPNKKNATTINRKEKLGFLGELLAPSETFDYVIGSNKSSGRLRAHSFNLNESKAIISGYPRNDIILKSNYKKEKKIIIGLFPTYRPYEYDFFAGLKFEEWEWHLEKMDAELWVKLHPSEQDIKHIKELKNVKIISSKVDINELLNQIDILITDYSSIYFDYLLLNRPIIFSCFDLNKYIEYTGGFWDEYSSRAGVMTLNWTQVLEEINGIIEKGLDPYVSLREKEIKRTFKYIDTDNRKRLVEKMISISKDFTSEN